MKQIEIDIRNIIDEVTCSKYTGRLKIMKDDLPEDGILWSLLLYLDTEMTPMILAYEGTEDEFKEFIRRELKIRKLQNVDFFKMHQELVEEEELLDYE